MSLWWPALLDCPPHPHLFGGNSFCGHSNLYKYRGPADQRLPPTRWFWIWSFSLLNPCSDKKNKRFHVNTFQSCSLASLTLHIWRMQQEMSESDAFTTTGSSVYRNILKFYLSLFFYAFLSMLEAGNDDTDSDQHVQVIFSNGLTMTFSINFTSGLAGQV